MIFITSKMEFLCKITNELTQEELSQVTSLYNRVFITDHTIAEMIGRYVNNPLGYAYHSMMKDNNQIVGFSAYIPAYYIYSGKRVLFAYAGDYMTDKPYRDFFNFRDIIKNAHTFMKENGVALNFGYPNDKAFPVMTKGKLTKVIGKMHIYCLPYRIGGIKSNLLFLNWLSVLGCRLYVLCCSLFAEKKNRVFLIHKEEQTYNLTRYKYFDGNYGYCKLKHGDFYYKIQDHEGVRTVFIIDVSPKSPRNYVDAIRYLIKNHSKVFDLILYPGELPFSVTGMVKLPRRVEPKNFNFTANILDKEAVDPKVIYNINNWDTNLSNYDLI